MLAEGCQLIMASRRRQPVAIVGFTVLLATFFSIDGLFVQRLAHLAAKHPVRKHCVAGNLQQHDGRAPQHEFQRTRM